MRVRNASKARLLDAGVALISRSAVVGVQKLLSPDALQDETREAGTNGGVSRHTAYRLWHDRGEAVGEIARHITDENKTDAWATFETVMKSHVDVLRELYANGGSSAPFLSRKSMKVAFTEIVGGSFRRQLKSTVVPASWALHGAALTSSPIWEGTKPDDELQRTGRQILEARAKFYDELHERWTLVLGGVLAWWGRRPRDGVSVQTIVKLISGMFDGYVLHLFVEPFLDDKDGTVGSDPDIKDESIAAACEAMFEVVMAYSVPHISDPRRELLADDRDAVADFEKLLTNAASCYEAPRATTVPMHEITSMADIPTDRASQVFPTTGDLGDSLLRRLVAPSGIELRLSKHMDPTPLLEVLLLRLRYVARRYPALIDVARHCRPSRPVDAIRFVDELSTEVSEALRSPVVRCPEPEIVASMLVDSALDGDHPWEMATRLLSAISVTSQRK